LENGISRTTQRRCIAHRANRIVSEIAMALSATPVSGEQTAQACVIGLLTTPIAEAFQLDWDKQ
jgi:hypothetical protein